MSRYDAIVVGGGAGGGSAALHLARAGWRVAVVERASFPRRKVCGEFLSSATFPVLDAAGIGAAARAAGGPPVTRCGIYGREAIVTAPMPLAPGATDPGRTVRRDVLDALLLEAAQDAGAELYQPFRAVGLESEAGLQTVEIAGDERIERLTAPIVVAAHGSWEPGTLPTQIRRPHRPDDLLAFKAYYRGARFDPDLITLAAFPGGYGGMVLRDGGDLGLSVCITRAALARARREHPAPTAGESAFRHAAATTRGVRQAVEGAEFSLVPMGAGPLNPGIRPGYARPVDGGGIFRVGNAAGEAHPSIAEGISIAIQSGALLGRHLDRIAPDDRAAVDAAGAAYAAAWRRQFGGRLRTAELFARACMSPALTAALAPVLATFPALVGLGAVLSGKTKALRLERA